MTLRKMPTLLSCTVVSNQCLLSGCRYAGYLGLPSVGITGDADFSEAAALRKNSFQLAFLYLLRQAPHKGGALVCVELSP